MTLIMMYECIGMHMSIIQCRHESGKVGIFLKLKAEEDEVEDGPLAVGAMLVKPKDLLINANMNLFKMY